MKSYLRANLGLILLSMYSGSASATNITVDGTLSLGSSAGLIIGNNQEFTYDGQTRNLAALRKGCPLIMSEIVPCTVILNADGNFATKIISARSPKFQGRKIRKSGSVNDAAVCDNFRMVDYVVREGCDHHNSLMIKVLSMKGSVTQIRWNGMIKYTLSQRVAINCQGSAVSLESYIGRNFPPGINSC